MYTSNLQNETFILSIYNLLISYNVAILFLNVSCFCAEVEVHRERQTAGADSGLSGQCVRCGSSAGGRRDQERSAGTHGGTAGTQHAGRHTSHTWHCPAMLRGDADADFKVVLRCHS